MPRKKKSQVLMETLLNGEIYKEIRADLMSQLQKSGSKRPVYTDLIDDYMNLWLTKNLLLDDIKTRGVNIRYNNGGGQSGVRKNDSVEQVLKVNTQMLKILDSMEIKPSTAAGGEDDEL